MGDRDFLHGLGELMRQQSILTQKISGMIPAIFNDAPCNQVRHNLEPISTPERSFEITSIVHNQNVMHDRQVLEALRSSSETLHRKPLNQNSDLNNDISMNNICTQAPTSTPVQRGNAFSDASSTKHSSVPAYQPQQVHSNAAFTAPPKRNAVQKKKRTRNKSYRVSLSVPLHDEDSYILKEPGLSRTLNFKATMKQVQTRLPYIKIQRGSSMTRWRVDMHISQSRNAALTETKRLMKTTDSITEAVQWRDDQLAKLNLRVGVCNGNWTVMPLRA